MESAHFGFSSRPLTDWRVWCKDVLLPLLYVLAVTLALVGVFAVCLHIGAGMEPVIPVHMDDGEWVDPSPMRLVFMTVAFVVAFVLVWLADHRRSTIGKYVLGYAGGTMLWQSVGECAWHFSVPAEDYIMCFPHIESASALIMVVVVTILLVYCYRRRAFSWAVWVFVLSFIGNWFGHFVQIGSFPLVAGLMEEGEWYVLTGSVVGGLTCVAALLGSVFYARTERGRLCFSLLLYFGIGIVITGVAGI